jgi:hypothetical protein
MLKFWRVGKERCVRWRVIGPYRDRLSPIMQRHRRTTLSNYLLTYFHFKAISFIKRLIYVQTSYAYGRYERAQLRHFGTLD